MPIDDDMLEDERAFVKGGRPAETKTEAAPEQASLLPAEKADDETAAAASAAAQEAAAATAAAAAADAVKAATKPTKEAPDPEPAKEHPKEPAKDEPPPLQKLGFESEGPKDFKTERKGLRAQEAAVDADWSTGKITDEERSAKIATIRDQLDDLLVSHTRSTTLDEANRQNDRNERVRVSRGIADAAKKDGAIDYFANEDARQQFDQFAHALSQTAKWKDQPYTAVAQEAHKMVLAINGKLTPTATPAATPAATADPKKARDVPVSLANMPAAAAAPLANDLTEQLAAIDDPDQAEAAFAAIPKAQRNALMRGTVKSH